MNDSYLIQIHPDTDKNVILPKQKTNIIFLGFSDLQLEILRKELNLINLKNNKWDLHERSEGRWEQREHLPKCALARRSEPSEDPLTRHEHNLPNFPNSQLFKNSHITDRSDKPSKINSSCHLTAVGRRASASEIETKNLSSKFVFFILKTNPHLYYLKNIPMSSIIFCEDILFEFNDFCKDNLSYINQAIIYTDFYLL